MTGYETGDSEPPEEPWQHSESLLSPASPKPLHFPQPTNVPVLDRMMDVGFNQTETHMSDATMRDTELRPGAWRDPDEHINDDSNHPASPFSTGGGGDAATKEVDTPVKSEPEDTTAHSNETLANGREPESVPVSNGISYQSNSQLHTEAEPDANATQDQPAPEQNVPTAEHAPSNVIPTQSAPKHVAQDQSQMPSQPQSAPFTGDVQALLDTLSTSTAPAATVAPSLEGISSPTQSHSQQHPDASSSVPGLVASSTGLPPRPPPQEQPLINPNYVHSQHIRDYHPHAANPALQTGHGRPSSQGNAADPNSHTFVPPVAASPQQTTFGNGQVAYQPQNSPDSALPPQSTLQSQQQFLSTKSPIESRREFKLASGETPTQEDQPWTADIQRKYDHFMEEERRYVNEARWDQFPLGSRLFVGNLSSEKVTKRDIFHVFHAYGELAQISIKQAYGFVQFLRVDDCARALEAEQNRQIRDKRIHLEISKPQKPSRNQQQQTQGRRSRSPDYGNRNRQNNDRYANGRGRGRDGRDGRDSRDGRDYRPSYRSPTPPRDHRDRYAERYRTRSRSPGYDRNDRYRGGSPRREPDDDLPLPRRQPRDVPDVQIIALDSLDRDFLAWVDKAFSSRGVRSDVLTISPRLSEDAVVRRQVLEGVLAVCKLRRINQETAKIGMTIFKRTPGNRDVQFEEYDNLDPPICAELAMREKHQRGMPPAPTYSGHAAPQPPQPPYGYQQPPNPYGTAPTAYPPAYGQPPASYMPTAPPAGYQPHPGRVDPNNLQNLLSTLNTTSPQGPQPQYGSQQPGFPPPPQSYSGQQYPSLPSGMPPPQQSQPGAPPPGQAPAPPNMQDILARLGTYRQ